MFFRFRCSRRVFPPVVPGLRCRPDFRPAFPPAVLGSRNVSALRLPLGACPFCRRFCLAALLRVSVRHFRPAFGSALPPVIPGLRSRPAFPSGGAWLAERFRAPPAFGGLSASARLVFCMRLLPHTAKTRLPESGRWLAALRRLPPGPFFRTGRRLRQRRNPRRTGCKVTYNSLIIAAFTIYSQFLQQRLRSP